jgi:hypothetical protein
MDVCRVMLVALQRMLRVAKPLKAQNVIQWQIHVSRWTMKVIFSSYCVHGGSKQSAIIHPIHPILSILPSPIARLLVLLCLPDYIDVSAIFNITYRVYWEVLPAMPNGAPKPTAAILVSLWYLGCPVREPYP